MDLGMATGSELSGAWFMAAMEHSPIGTALVGLDGRWLWTNHALRDTLSYGRAELERLSFQDITHPDDLNKDLNHVERLIAGDGIAYQMEKRYFRKNGSTVWCLLSVSIVRDAQGMGECFISKVQDIDRRKAVELEHAALTERLTLATQAGGVGVWEWDIATNALIWDTRMFELYDIDPSIKPDYTIFLNAVAPEHRERVDGLLQGAVAGFAPALSMVDGGNIRCEVRDTGIGIPADKQHLLFRRFSQVDQSIARRFGGSGLGLAICERLVAAMGGTIGLTSECGVGSVFWFAAPLPVSEAPALLGRIVPMKGRRATERRRILLAEDVEMNQLLAVALLEKQGHDVTVVGNGAEALARVQVQKFDLVLMDVQMPVMDGIEATRRIRTLGGKFARLPIIAVTANVMPDDIACFRNMGMSDHIGKPIPIDGFEMILERWCPAVRQEVALADKFAKAATSARSSAG